MLGSADNGKYKFYCFNDLGHTVYTSKLPESRAEQCDYICAEMAILCTECTLGTITEDKIYDYARRISYVITKDVERIDYNLNIEIAHLLLPAYKEKNFRKLDMSYDEAYDINEPFFQKIAYELIKINSNYEKDMLY